MRIIRNASIFGILAVLLGAFGAHAIKDQLSLYQVDIYNTAVEYQFIHSLALLAVGILIMGFEAGDAENKALKHLHIAAKCFAIGIFLFSGSLYLLAAKDLLMLSEYSHILGPITPIGGLFFIIGWVFLLIASSSKRV